MSRRLRASCAESGQATVELLALIPVVVAVGIAAFCVLAAGRAREVAGHAAGAGAVALLQDGDPKAAARRAAGRSSASVLVTVEDRVVTVRVSPRLPVRPLQGILSATRSADTGPEPRW